MIFDPLNQLHSSSSGIKINPLRSFQQKCDDHESTEASDWLTPIRPDQSRAHERAGPPIVCGCYGYLYQRAKQIRAAQQVQKVLTPSPDRSCDVCSGRRRRRWSDWFRPSVAAFGNGDSEIVGQRCSCLTGRPASIFLSAPVGDPEEQQRGWRNGWLPGRPVSPADLILFITHSGCRFSSFLPPFARL